MKDYTGISGMIWFEQRELERKKRKAREKLSLFLLPVGLILMWIY